MNFIMNGIHDFNMANINGKEIKITYNLAADYKFLMIILGLKASNSNFSCFLCKCHKDDFPFRIHSLLRNLDSESKTEFKFYGFERKPLINFSMIPLDRIIICLLHLILRIFEFLCKDLIFQIVNLDRLKGCPILSQHENIRAWINFLEEIGINTYIKAYDEESMGGVTRDFTGSEILKILLKIDLKKLFPKIKNVDEKKTTWDLFHKIIRVLSSGGAIIQFHFLEKILFEFSDKLEKFYVSKTLHKPYLHFLFNHLLDCILEIKDLSIYSQQGLEKLNDITTKEYFRASNKKYKTKNNFNYIKQILLRRIRIEFFETNNL